MKKYYILIFLLFLLNSFVSAQAQSGRKGEMKHTFLCADYTQGIVCIISDEGKILWQYPAERCNDIWALPNGDILFNTGNGVKEVTRDKKIVFSYESKSEIYACQRLSNGNTFIACSDHNGEPRIVEVDQSGKIVWQLSKNELPGIELKFMAGMQYLPNGNLLLTNWVGHNEFGNAPHAFEVTREKKVIWLYNDTTFLKTMSSIQLLDSDADYMSSSILH